jgi:hypothetical protein
VTTYDTFKKMSFGKKTIICIKNMMKIPE